MRTPSLLSSTLTLVLLALAGAGHAETISFDEFPPANDASLIGEQYADLGIHFVPTDDGSIWAGTSGGDPGRWGLEGTNGTAFLGFNGASYLLAALFDGPVHDVALDVSGGRGSTMEDTFTLAGFLDGELVEEVTVTLGGHNVWQTVALTETVDEIQMSGEGAAFHPFGVDNLQWSSAGTEGDPGEPGEGAPSEEQPPETLSVQMDLEPWSRWSSWWHKRWAPAFVVLYGSDDFDAESVDPDSLALGPDAASASRFVMYWDMNRDGLVDMIARFSARETGLDASDEEACVTGETVEGLLFEGCDVREPDPRKHHRRRHHRRHDH